MFAQYLFAVLNGIATGAAAFLVAAGLTLTFGVLKILNFAHGAFFMIGAYLTYMLVGSQPVSIPWLAGASVIGGIIVGLLGLLTDQIVFKKLRGHDQHYTLIATFGLLLFCNGLTKLAWGLDIHSTNPPDSLDGMVLLGGIPIGIYSIALIAMAIAVFLTLDLVIHRLWIGKIVMAVARDPWAAAIMGINVTLVMTLSVVAGFALAGLAGGLLLANQSLSPELGDTYLLFAFNAVIIGGLGNIRGAFLAAMMLGIIASLGTVFMPDLPGLTPYLALVAFLLFKPDGLFPARAH